MNRVDVQGIVRGLSEAASELLEAGNETTQAWRCNWEPLNGRPKKQTHSTMKTGVYSEKQYTTDEQE